MTRVDCTCRCMGVSVLEYGSYITPLIEATCIQIVSVQFFVVWCDKIPKCLYNVVIFSVLRQINASILNMYLFLTESFFKKRNAK